jgi:hypothetical protein
MLRSFFFLTQFHLQPFIPAAFRHFVAACQHVPCLMKKVGGRAVQMVLELPPFAGRFAWVDVGGGSWEVFGIDRYYSSTVT